MNGTARYLNDRHRTLQFGGECAVGRPSHNGEAERQARRLFNITLDKRAGRPFYLKREL